MPSVLRAMVVFALLCGGTAFGFVLKSQFMEPHMGTGTLEPMGMIISFLITITAIVIGLLINSTKTYIDTTQDHWAIFAGQLIRLDQTMRNYGSDSEPMRRQLQSFAAAAMVNSWREDAVPAGVTYPDVRKLSRYEAGQVLSELLDRIELGIYRLKPHDLLHERLAADCLDQYKQFARARWSLLLAPQYSLPTSLLRMLVGWLMIIFVCFAVRTPADPVMISVITLAAATLSSMVFAIIDVVDPYKGLYNISSKNMHYALDAMLRHNGSVNVSTGSPAASDERATRPPKADETDSALLFSVKGGRQ